MSFLCPLSPGSFARITHSRDTAVTETNKPSRESGGHQPRYSGRQDLRLLRFELGVGEDSL